MSTSIDMTEYCRLFDESNLACLRWLENQTEETKLAFERAQQAVKDYLMKGREAA